MSVSSVVAMVLPPTCVYSADITVVTMVTNDNTRHIYKTFYKLWQNIFN